MTRRCRRAPTGARAELRAWHATLPERLGWKYVPLSLAFWTVLWPLGLVALAVCLVRREVRLRGTDAHLERRVERLLCFYPLSWRDRHGDDLADLLRDALADGRGGARLTVDVAREGIAERLASVAEPRTRAVLLLSFCSIPLFPQGIVPLVMTYTGAPSRSWFVALYLPEPFQRAFAIAMICLGAAMLVRGLRVACSIRPRPVPR